MQKLYDIDPGFVKLYLGSEVNYFTYFLKLRSVVHIGVVKSGKIINF